MSSIDYSQTGEQEYILAHSGPPGHFLDIGAWTATTFSNTRALFEAGWSGVLIEPSPGPFLQLLRTCSACGTAPLEHYGGRRGRRPDGCFTCGQSLRYGQDPRLTLILAAVGLTSSLLRLHATDDALTTSSGTQYEVWRDKGGFYGCFHIPQITLESIAAQFGADFGFVSIDTEGTSVDLCGRMLDLNIRPRCICVEHDGHIDGLTSHAERHGYRPIYTSAINMVLAATP
jgi:hypothetical protein